MKVGDVVLVKGITAEDLRHLNGKAGQIVGRDRHTGEWHVRVAEKGGSTMALSEAHLQVAVKARLTVLFQHDYSPELVGLYMVLYPKLGTDHTARAVLGCKKLTPRAKQIGFIQCALAEPQRCREIIDCNKATEDETVPAWADDLDLVIRQIAWHRHRHWVVPSIQAWGHAYAQAAVHVAEGLSNRVRDEPHELTFPSVFGKISTGETLMYWQPMDFLAKENRCPRERDPTYAAFRFREMKCKEAERLHQADLPLEHPGITIQVRQVWLGILMKTWLQQSSMARHTGALDGSTYCNIIGEILGMVDTSVAAVGNATGQNSPGPRKERTCTGCGQRFTPAGPFTCPCRQAHYCGHACQVSHWGQHKSTCLTRAANRSVPRPWSTGGM